MIQDTIINMPGVNKIIGRGEIDLLRMFWNYLAERDIGEDGDKQIDDFLTLYKAK